MNFIFDYSLARQTMNIERKQTTCGKINKPFLFIPITKRKPKLFSLRHRNIIERRHFFIIRFNVFSNPLWVEYGALLFKTRAIGIDLFVCECLIFCYTIFRVVLEIFMSTLLEHVIKLSASSRTSVWVSIARYLMHVSPVIALEKSSEP